MWIYKDIFFWFKKFIDDGNGNVKGVETVQIEWKKDDQGRWQIVEIPGRKRLITRIFTCIRNFK